MSDIVQLAKCYDDMVQWMFQCDTKLLGSVLSDSIQLFHANGESQSKQEWFDIVSPDLKNWVYIL